MEKTNVKAYFSAWANDFSVEDFTNTLGVEPTRSLNKIALPQEYYSDWVYMGIRYRLRRIT